jgi:hypothetical protein
VASHRIAVANGPLDVLCADDSAEATGAAGADRRTTMTTSTDPTALEADDLSTPTPQMSTVILALVERTVTFTGRMVTSIPDPFRQHGPGQPVDPEVVYLTRMGKVAIHDLRRRALSVLELDDFVNRYIDSPFSWIVDEVLDEFPRPIEQLDI